MPMGCATTETALIIYLGVTGNTHFLPDMNEKGHGIFRTATCKWLSSRVTGNNVNGIETRYTLTAGEIMRHDIHLAELVCSSRFEMWILDLWFDPFLFGLCHPGLFQNTLYAWNARQSFDLFFLQPRSDCYCSDIFEPFTQSCFGF